MNTASIRWRLPISYAAIALLTAIVLGSILFFTLRSSYTEQELRYLTNSAELMSPGMTRYLESESSSPFLGPYVRNLSFMVQARIRILDLDGQVIADSGSLQTQRFIYTNLTPDGMRADVVREGKAERYLYYVGVNIVDGPSAWDDLGDNTVFLSQLPTENTLCGFGAGSKATESLRHTDHAVDFPLVNATGEPVGTILISEGLAFGSKILDTVARAWAYASSVAVLVAAGSGWWISRRLVAPLSDLTHATQKMAAGDLSTRTYVNTKDEFGVLGRSFNAMAVRIEEMVATLRSFVADAAHELHTPLTTLRVNLDLAADDPANLQDYLLPAQTQVNRLQTLVDSLLDLSRIEVSSTGHVQFSLSELVEEIAEEYALQAQQAKLFFSLQLLSENTAIVGDAFQIRRALENLLENALKFTPAQGVITLRLVADAKDATISVQDTGIGIPQQDMSKLFQRFHRGRNAVGYSGSGLGLAIVKAIVDRHKGTLAVASDGNGTRITLKVPLL